MIAEHICALGATYLQQTRQLRVAVRNVIQVFDERRDDAAERQQRLSDGANERMRSQIIGVET